MITIRIAKEIHSSDNLEDTNNYALSNLFFNLKEHLNLFIESYQLFMERFIFPNCPLKKTRKPSRLPSQNPQSRAKINFLKQRLIKNFPSLWRIHLKWKLFRLGTHYLPKLTNKNYSQNPGLTVYWVSINIFGT